MATKMKDPNKSSNRKKKKEDTGNDSDDIGISDDMGTEHLNGDGTEADADPYEWEDDSNNPADPDDRRRQIRNKTEKQRKDKIRSWIGRISDLVPNCSDRLGSGKKQVKSMNFILEKCYDYIVTLREQNTALLTGKGDEAQAAEINRLKKELREATEERDTFAKLLKENKPRVDASKLWSDRLDALKINPEKVDLTKIIKTMRKPHNFSHVITGQESDEETTPKKKRKVSDFESESDEIENRPPLIDCNGGNNNNNEEVPMFSPGSDISNVTPVDIPMPEVDEMTSAKDLENHHGLYAGQSALQTLASVATTDMSGCDVTPMRQTTTELLTDQSQVSLQQPVANSSTSVAQSLTMPIMSTSQQKTTQQLSGTQLSGNIIMQNGQLIVLNEPLSSAEAKKKSPDKSSLKGDEMTSSDIDQSQQMVTQQQNLLANQQMNLGLSGQLPLLNQQGMVPNQPGILPMNLGMQQQQQSNLPQALILPDGRIIPVVTQPNLMFPGQMNNVLMPGNQSQTLIGSGANLFMNQPGINSSQGQPLATSGGGLQNLDPNLQPLLQQQILGQQQVGLPLTNYMVNSDGQVIQSVQQGLNQFPGMSGQILSQQTNLSTTKSSNAHNKDLGQNSQGMQHVQVITSSGTVLTLQVPAGTPTQQILLDPNTLQPIGQQQQQQKMAAPQTQATSLTSVTTTTTSSATVVTGGKKNKKGQRVLMPKPTALLHQQGPSMAPQNLVHLQTAPLDQKEEVPNKKSQKMKELTISQKLQALTANSGGMDDSTDILAKAAESIFAGDMAEYSDEKSETIKDKKKRKKSGKNNKDKDPTATMSGKDLAHFVIGSSELPNAQHATNDHIATLADDSGTMLQQEIHKVPEVPKKKTKKKAKAKEIPAKIDPNSLPDTITFDENDLSDVLDQVENISVPVEKSPEKKNKKTGKVGEPDKKKRKQDRMDLDSHDDVADPGLQIVLDPQSSNSPASEMRTSPMKAPNRNESPPPPMMSGDNDDCSTTMVASSRTMEDDSSDPFSAGSYVHGNNSRPTKDATLKAIDSDEPKDSNILDSISRIMESPEPATPSGELEKETLLTDNLSLLSSMATADREHDRADENATQKELFPDLPSKPDDRQKDNFSPFNFTDSPSNHFDMEKRLKDLSPTSSASAPLLRHSVEAMFSSGKKDKDSTSMPGSILSQLNSPTMDLTIQEEKDDASKPFPAQQLLPELDTKQKEKEPPAKERTAFFTSEGLAQPTSEPRKETMSAPSYFDLPANMKSVIQKADKTKDPPNFYGGLMPEKVGHEKVVSEFARNSPPPLSTSSFFNPPTQTSSAFSAPVTSSVAPFSFSLTSSANSAPTTTTPSGSFGSHHFPFYPLHPSLSTGNSQGNDSMNLNLQFGDSGRGMNAPPSLSMNNMNQSQPRYPNYGNMNQGNQFVEPQPMKGPMVNPRFPQPRRPIEMNQPRPYQDLNQFDQTRMAPRMPNQFDIRNQRPPETSQSPTMPYTSPSMPGCEMGGVKNRTPDCTRPSSGEIRSRRQSDQGSHLGTSPRMSDINQSPRMPEMNPSPRLGDLNQSPRLSDMNQSPRIDQSPGRADNPKQRMNDIIPPQQQTRPRSGPGPQPMFYPQPFNPPNPMTSPPLHHPSRDLEMRPNFGDTTFNPPQDFNPVLNFGASGFDPPPLELSSSGSSATTQSQTFSRSSQPISQPSKPRDRNPPPPAPPPKRAPPAPKPKSRPKTKKASKPYEMDTNLSNSIFETGRSMTPYGFPISMPSPPPSRSDAPTYINMPFGPSRPLSNTGLMQHKPSPEMNSFGPLFSSNRPQNGLGLNFQPGFGMNHMAHGNGPPPHPNNVSVTPHMPFSLSNIFSDMGQGQGDLNISPIKFPHGTLPQPDHIQHHHQPGIYHQRGHAPMIPNAMSINSLLGHNHGFDGRPMGPGMGSPFHGPGTPGLGMPPFNFNVHDH